ncbi:MAG: NACHT domain-containing protein, partial [Caldilinea sp.]
MENSPQHVALSDQQITRKAVRSALKSLDDAMKLGAHPLAALRIVDVQRAKANYPDNPMGCGLALRDLLRMAVETLRPDNAAPKPQEREWRHYLVSQEYVARRNPHDLQVEMSIAASTYDHEQAAMLDRLVAVLSEWELASRKKPPDWSEHASVVRADWGEMRDVTGFCGRMAELAQLRRWVIEERYRLVAVIGIGGVGKTALIEQLTTELVNEFDAVIWRSLVNAPPIESILRECIHFLAGPSAAGFDTIDEGIRRLVAALRTRRCLLILDNLETIFQSNAPSGQHRPGYEAYDQLISSIGERVHQSCLLLTSREASPELIRLETGAAPARILRLKGMKPADVHRLLHSRPIHGAEDAWTALTHHYEGNPLALLLTAYTIQELFAGNIARFLQEESTVFGDVRQTLDVQISRLSTLEREALDWLVVAREPIAVDALLDWCVEPVAKSDLLSALQSLHRRSLIESQAHHFSLQNMVLEYGTERLVERLRQAVIAGDLTTLDHLPLVQTQAKEYVRQSQERMIVQPLLQQLVHRYSRADAVAQICLGLLKKLRSADNRFAGYAAGNLLNLLQRLPCSLEHIDCAGLTIREANLCNTTLQGADFSHAHFVRPRFFQTFGAVSALAGSPDGAWLAIGAADGRLALWRVDEDSLRCIWPGHDAWVMNADFSPDGALLATVSEDRTVKVWQVGAGAQPPRCVHTLRGHAGRVRAVAFQPVTAPSYQSHKPLIASGGDDRLVRVFDARTMQERAALPGHGGAVRWLAFTPDSKV